ncbi:MAG TPA: DUF4234 domain-containing protein [Burkholderiales bacterium]|nr:DUF4234 domain-containing protein [Burkholderiales bacterium]
MKSAQAVGASTFNPYAAPAAAVADAEPARDEAIFFPVSLLKLSLMSVVTLGIYNIYWFYKNWKAVQKLGDDVNAPVRALFYTLTSYWLFKKVREQAELAQVVGNLPAGLLALALFFIGSLWRLPDPWWIVGFASFLPLLPVQSTVNALNRKRAPRADANSRFSGWNIAGLVAGGILVLAGVLGTFIGE